MRMSPAALLLALVACSPKEDDTAPLDIADDSGVGTDSSDTADTDSGDTSDTADTDSGDTSDTAVESDSPYSNCEEVGVSTDGFSWVKTYDALGQLTRFLYIGATYVNVYAYTWDGDGHIVATLTDFGDDGSIDQLEERTFDERDNWITYTITANGVLTASQSQVYTYHADGSITMYLYDTMSTPIVMARNEYTYDERGSLLTHIYDIGDDGVLEYDYWYAYTYDDNGAVVSQTRDSNNDGTLESLNVYTYDAEGRMLSARNTNPSGRDPDYYTLNTWAYDAEGNNVFYAWEGHQQTGYTQVKVYDAEGRMIERRSDTDPQGSVDFIQTITYTCP